MRTGKETEHAWDEEQESIDTVRHGKIEIINSTDGHLKGSDYKTANWIRNTGSLDVINVRRSVGALFMGVDCTDYKEKLLDHERDKGTLI